MINPEPRLLILGAHPDDAEFHAGGLAAAYRALNREVKLISVTDGAAGHHVRSPEELITLRKQEAANAGNVIGATYETWEFPDASLQPTLEVRHRIIREIREFQPDLVLTHRTSDYHPDHRAVGQCVQDASYLVTVPHVVPEVPALRKDPVVAYMPDLFTRPAPMQPQVVLDITQHVDTIVNMLACHRSQVFEWLAYEGGLLEAVPANEEDKIIWLKGWLLQHIRPRTKHFQTEMNAAFGTDAASSVELIEAFEVSEYAQQPDRRLLEQLFPGARFVS
ncbi:MAG: GlcNAc-PI de-N-acetylase [Blastopirellula sp.]|nr:MAG: GlcNAc-PI de-N-acetylase [Blastopirellula sp.]